jgi:hypothetical protein
MGGAVKRNELQLSIFAGDVLVRYDVIDCAGQTTWAEAMALALRHHETANKYLAGGAEVRVFVHDPDGDYPDILFTLEPRAAN